MQKKFENTSISLQKQLIAQIQQQKLLTLQEINPVSEMKLMLCRKTEVLLLRLDLIKFALTFGVTDYAGLTKHYQAKLIDLFKGFYKEYKLQLSRCDEIYDCKTRSLLDLKASGVKEGFLREFSAKLQLEYLTYQQFAFSVNFVEKRLLLEKALMIFDELIVKCMKIIENLTFSMHEILENLEKQYYKVNESQLMLQALAPKPKVHQEVQSNYDVNLSENEVDHFGLFSHASAKSSGVANNARVSATDVIYSISENLAPAPISENLASLQVQAESAIVAAVKAPVASQLSITLGEHHAVLFAKKSDSLTLQEDLTGFSATVSPAEDMTSNNENQTKKQQG